MAEEEHGVVLCKVLKACPRKEQLAVAALAMGCKATTIVAMREDLHIALGLAEVVPSSGEDDEEEPEGKLGGGNDGRGDASGKYGGDAGSGGKGPGKPKPPPPPPVDEWAMHLDSVSNRPYWPNSAMGVTTFQDL